MPGISTIREGVFESCAVVAEGNEDRSMSWSVAPSAAAVRYIERMARVSSMSRSMLFVDSGLTYSGEPVTHISGLEHLEGKRSAILADGAVHPQRRQGRRDRP